MKRNSMMNCGMSRKNMLYSWKIFLNITFQIKRGLGKDTEILPLQMLFLLLDKAECQNKPKTIDVLQAGKKMTERKNKSGKSNSEESLFMSTLMKFE